MTAHTLKKKTKNPELGLLLKYSQSKMPFIGGATPYTFECSCSGLFTPASVEEFRLLASTDIADKHTWGTPRSERRLYSVRPDWLFLPLLYWILIQNYLPRVSPGVLYHHTTQK